MSGLADMQDGTPAPPTDAPATDAPLEDSGLRAAAFAASPVATVLLDVSRPEATIVAANPAFAALAGRRLADLAGRTYPLDGAADAGRLRDAVAAGQPARMVLGAGPPVEVRLAPLPAADGGPRHLCATHVALEGEGAEQAQALQVALDQKTALLHELDHRVKNNLQVIMSLVLLKARRTADPTARAALSGMADRIGALSTAHRLLYPVGDVSRFDLKEFVTDFAADLAVMVDRARIAVTVDAEPVAVVAAKAAPLALLVHELATNATHHAFPAERSGRVAITVRRDGHQARLVVEDDGVGRDPAAADGFGRALVDMVVRQMRGSLAYEDCRPGTRVTIAVPLTSEEAEA